MNTKTNNTVVTLLTATIETVRWIDGVTKQISSNCGVKLKRATIARAVLSGLCAAKASFASCRSEFEIQDRVRDMARIAAATATEGK
jgi:hypothetical protein